MRPFRKKSAVSGRGATILEFLVYLAVIVVVVVAATALSYEFAIGRAKADAVQETERNAQLALARLVAEVRQAEGFNIGDSVFGSHPGRLSLSLADVSKSPTVFFVDAGRLMIQQGAGSALPLTSSRVQVSEFVVDDLSTASGRSRLVRVRIKTDFLSTGLGLYSADSTLETTAQIKKADGFSD